MDFDGNDAYGPTNKICQALENNQCITTPPGYFKYWSNVVPNICPGGNFDTNKLKTFCKSGNNDPSKISFGHYMNDSDPPGQCYLLKDPKSGRTIKMMGVDFAASSPEMGYSSWKYLFNQDPKNVVTHSSCGKDSCLDTGPAGCAQCKHSRLPVLYKKIDC